MFKTVHSTPRQKDLTRRSGLKFLGSGIATPLAKMATRRHIHKGRAHGPVTYGPHLGKVAQAGAPDTTGPECSRRPELSRGPGHGAGVPRRGVALLDIHVAWVRLAARRCSHFACLSLPCVAAPRQQAPPAAGMRSRQPSEDPARTPRRRADARPRRGGSRADVLLKPKAEGLRETTHQSRARRVM